MKLTPPFVYAAYPYGAFIREKIFTPLGMKDSVVDSTSDIIPNRTAGYTGGTDGFVNACFLATEENYQLIRQMQSKNMFIPVVGDFAGPKAIRKVADYVKQHNSIVSVFYLSNVETYLFSTARGGTPEELQRFYENAASLPVDRSSLFIRFVGAQNSDNLRWWKGGWLQVVSPMVDLRDRINAGGKPTYSEALQASPDPKTLAP